MVICVQPLICFINTSINKIHNIHSIYQLFDSVFITGHWQKRTSILWPLFGVDTPGAGARDISAWTSVRLTKTSGRHHQIKLRDIRFGKEEKVPSCGTTASLCVLRMWVRGGFGGGGVPCTGNDGPIKLCCVRLISAKLCLYRECCRGRKQRSVKRSLAQQQGFNTVTYAHTKTDPNGLVWLTHWY